MILVVALGATFGVWHLAREDDRREIKTKFDFRVDETISRLEQRMAAYEQVLRGVRGLFVSLKFAKRDEFHAYVESLHLEENYKGIQGVGFSLIVPKSQKDRHVATIRKDGFPGYTLRPKGERNPYTSIIYLEPFNWRNQRAFGYDMFSEPVRHAAMEQARDQGKTSMSGKVVLVQETDKQVQSGFLMYLPVYTKGSTPVTLEERRTQILGWVYAPFRMGDLMAGVAGEHTGELDFRVYDGAEVADSMQMYESYTGERHESGLSNLRTVKRLEINGHPWTLVIDPLPSFADRIGGGKPKVIGIAGIGLSLLLTLVTWLLATGRKRALALATEMNCELTERNQQLDFANRQLSRATRLRDEFLANMSHELRTPLNAILGMTEALQEEVIGPIDDHQRQALHTIEVSGTHLLELINDILDLAKIEAGEMVLDCVPVSMQQLCKSSLLFIKQQAQQKSICLEVSIQADLPYFLLDERRIRQVLINLLNNAVKFSHEGGDVKLAVGLDQATNNNGASLKRDVLLIEVIDRGIGIAPEDIGKLFQPFVQIDGALNRQYSGTGLGLAMVKQIVELHGGRVEVCSEVGKGSRFAVSLPCDKLAVSPPELAVKAQLDTLPKMDELPGKPHLLLLVEDNEANMYTFSSYLKAKGYRLLLARDGNEAVKLAQANLPSLILMDIQLTGVDGLAATRRIRSDKKLANIPIIALTALAMPEDRERCLAAGADDYLSKPVKLSQLVGKIQKLLLR